MEPASLNFFLAFQAACLLLLVLTFIFWFRLRESASGDLACVIVATCCAGFLYLSSRLLGPEGCIGGIFGLPGFGVYLWFMGLWGGRRSQVRLRQWGRRHGYRIVSIERQYHLSREAHSRGPEYRILARRLADGEVLVGEVYGGPSGFRVHWIPVPPKHLPHGHPRAAAPPVPNPPHDTPPAPSKE